MYSSMVLLEVYSCADKICWCVEGRSLEVQKVASVVVVVLGLVPRDLVAGVFEWQSSCSLRLFGLAPTGMSAGSVILLCLHVDAEALLLSWSSRVSFASERRDWNLCLYELCARSHVSWQL